MVRFYPSVQETCFYAVIQSKQCFVVTQALGFGEKEMRGYWPPADRDSAAWNLTGRAVLRPQVGGLLRCHSEQAVFRGTQALCRREKKMQEC